MSPRHPNTHFVQGAELGEFLNHRQHDLLRYQVIPNRSPKQVYNYTFPLEAYGVLLQFSYLKGEVKQNIFYAFFLF